MNRQMRKTKFSKWLETLKIAWVKREPKKAVQLVADRFEYYEEPLEKPITKKEALIEVWKEVPKTQKDILFNYKIVAEKNNLGVAEWEAKYVSIKTNKKFKLNGVFLVRLNKDGRATEFKQWWSTKEL